MIQTRDAIYILIQELSSVTVDELLGLQIEVQNVP